MPDLVDAELLRLTQGAGVVERLLLEEAPGGRAAREELTIADPFLLLGREHRAFRRWLPVVDELHRALLELVAASVRCEAFDHEEAVAVVGVDLRVRQHGRQAMPGDSGVRHAPGASHRALR